LLARALAEGFSYQGEPSVYDGGRPRGEISAQLPPTAFVSFLQNHDQVGNRARGERLSTLVSNDAALHAATALILLAPSPPLLFMGEEWSASEPFPYFCDVEPGLADKVRDGRRREFERFGHFAIDPPDPMAASTFASAQLDWSHVRVRPHATRLQYCRRLLAVRAREIVPLLPQLSSGRCVASSGDGAFAVEWRLPEPAVLRVLVNLSARAAPLCGRAAGRVLFATHPNVRKTLTRRELEPWSVIWLRERAGENAIDPG
jgi:1,4-alpha-glucan branching enzyme